MSVATTCALASRASSRWMITGVKSYPWLKGSQLTRVPCRGAFLSSNYVFPNYLT